jgi:hypothetical protein
MSKSTSEGGSGTVGAASVNEPETGLQKAGPLTFDSPVTAVRLPPVYPTKEPGVGVMKIRFRTSPAASATDSEVKALEKIPIVGFIVNGPATLGENPVAVKSAEWIAPGGGGLGLLSMTMSPPSLQVGVQRAPVWLLGAAVADRSRVMTPARAVPPANPAATNVAAKMPVRRAANVVLRNVENIVTPSLDCWFFCRDGVRSWG